MRVRSRVGGGLALAVLAFWLPWAAARGDVPAEPPAEPSGPAAEAAPGIAYEVVIAGAEDAALAALLEASSQLIELADRPPQSLTRLRLRGEADVERLGRALRSLGYYDGAVAVEIDEGTRPVTVTLRVMPGPQYRLESFAVRVQGETQVPAETMPLLSALPIRIGGPALAADILAAEGQIVAHLQGRGYPFARHVDREATIYRDRQAMTVVAVIEPGPLAAFGTTTVSGLEQVRERHVRRLLEWSPGEQYDAGKVQASRRALGASRLFSSATVQEAEALALDGTLPMTVTLQEAEHRTVGFGARYSTDIGPGAEVFWTHRNLFGEGESLDLGLNVATSEQAARANYRDAGLFDGRFTLLGDLTVANRLLNAFDERSIAIGAALEWPFAETWRARAGVTLELQEIVDETAIDDDTQRFVLVGTPLTLSHDGSDDRLNPTRGTRLEATLTPYVGAGERPLAFVTATLGGSAYQALDADRRFVLAGRGRIGSLLGEQTDDIPANKRFYAGGGGSIRGYEFQTVGPLDRNNNPLGGRSLLELGAELRIRVSETIGIVPFLDGGTVFDSPLPDFDEELRWGAGIGLRYYTAIGPLRADFAVPLNKRPGDDDFQFYVSIGQAF